MVSKEIGGNAFLSDNPEAEFITPQPSDLRSDEIIINSRSFWARSALNRERYVSDCSKDVRKASSLTPTMYLTVFAPTRARAKNLRWWSFSRVYLTLLTWFSGYFASRGASERRLEFPQSKRRDRSTWLA
jgi:hypothetical protein